MRIVVIVDMQRDFINGSLGTPEAEIAVQNAIQWLRGNLSDEDLVVMTQDTHSSEYLQTPEGRCLPIEHCLIGSKGWEIWPDLSSVVEKNVKEIFSKNTFGCRELSDWIIRNIDYGGNEDEVIIMGLCTDICVISNALIIKQAFGNYYDPPIKVLSDCCAGTTPAKHEAALEVMKSCQIEVV